MHRKDSSGHLLSRCGHCKHLTPEYKKLGEAVASSPKLKDRVIIAKVTQPNPLGAFLAGSTAACRSHLRYLQNSELELLNTG